MGFRGGVTRGQGFRQEAHNLVKSSIDLDEMAGERDL